MGNRLSCGLRHVLSVGNAVSAAALGGVEGFVRAFQHTECGLAGSAFGESDRNGHGAQIVVGGAPAQQRVPISSRIAFSAASTVPGVSPGKMTANSSPP